MSVEKTISYEEIPYFQVYTHVVQNINHLEAGFVWVYLLSKPSNWQVIKEHLKNKFSIGDDKMKEILAYLNKHRLIEYITHRCPKGRIEKQEIKILNGSKFLNDEEVKELSTGDAKTDRSTGVKNQPQASHTCGFRGLQIKEDTNKRKSTNKRKTKSFYENEKKHDFAKSMDQMALEKKHIEEHERMKQVPIPKEFRGLVNTYNRSEQTSPRYRDFTQERLDREAREEREKREITLVNKKGELHEDARY